MEAGGADLASVNGGQTSEQMVAELAARRASGAHMASESLELPREASR